MNTKTIILPAFESYKHKYDEQIDRQSLKLV